jgi:hypothetical protein
MQHFRVKLHDHRRQSPAAHLQQQCGCEAGHAPQPEAGVPRGTGKGEGPGRVARQAVRVAVVAAAGVQAGAAAHVPHSDVAVPAACRGVGGGATEAEAMSRAVFSWYVVWCVVCGQGAADGAVGGWSWHHFIGSCPLHRPSGITGCRRAQTRLHYLSCYTAPSALQCTSAASPA